MHLKLSLAAAGVIIQALVAAIPFSSLPSTDIDPAISDNFVNANDNEFIVDVRRDYEANGMQSILPLLNSRQYGDIFII